ncbi:MAG TPA: nucleotidyl transferase AbiEii/AbiGii toxin family protein [Actinomycetota bacterium]|nr:nucleotidyl transferase AbiEii/AbiGii toxin family protein [Actinomycetota bacterium]
MASQGEFSPEERREWAGRFGVAAGAIHHDHLISHLLLALSTWDQDVLLYGGTALSRTHLSGFRLSEDIDLQIISPGRHIGPLGNHLMRAIRRDYPDATWERRSAPRDQTIAYLHADDLAVRVHLIGPDENLPAETVPIELRYSDLPESVSLRVPTRSAVAAMKTGAYMDRAAPRDLVDLDGLANLGALNEEAARVLKDVFGLVVVQQEFDRVRLSTAQAWEAELERLMRERPSPEACLQRVKDAYSQALGW